MRALLPFIVILVAALWSPSARGGEAAGPVICVDAGHGGSQPGAIAHKLQEKDITLEIATRLKFELEKSLGARVILTRDSDVEVDLSERIRMANAANAEIFVSIHCNSMPFGPERVGTRGVETYFLSAEATGEQARRVAARENAEAKRSSQPADTLTSILNDLAQAEAHRDASALAYAVHQRLVKDLGSQDRGVHQAPFMVLMGAQMAAILIEVGFISNASESELLATPTYQTKIVRSVTEGIRGFLVDIARRNTPAAPAAAPVTPGGVRP